MAVFGKWGSRGPYKKGELKIKYTKLLIVLEAVGVIMLLAILIYTAFKYSMLPDNVPTHYGSDGKADAWGGKTHLWFVPITAVFIYLLTTVAAFFPNSWNYPGKVKIEKLTVAENIMREMMMYVKLIINILFCYMQYKILSLSVDMSMIVTFGLVILLFGVIIFHVIKLKRNCM